MKLFQDLRSTKDKRFDHVELCYSGLMWISGNHKWFCRIWRKNWLDKIGDRQKSFGESYGRNKFEAYRLALNDLQSSASQN